MNVLRVIHPYKYQGAWVFDDDRAGLVREPFVSGADVILDRMSTAIPGAQTGFSRYFSAQPFPGHQDCFEWRREEYGANWYFSALLNLEGWLCPARFNYFEQAPRKINLPCKAKGA